MDDLIFRLTVNGIASEAIENFLRGILRHAVSRNKNLRTTISADCGFEEIAVIKSKKKMNSSMEKYVAKLENYSGGIIVILDDKDIAR